MAGLTHALTRRSKGQGHRVTKSAASMGLQVDVIVHFSSSRVLFCVLFCWIMLHCSVSGGAQLPVEEGSAVHEGESNFSPLVDRQQAVWPHISELCRCASS